MRLVRAAFVAANSRFRQDRQATGDAHARQRRLAFTGTAPHHRGAMIECSEKLGLLPSTWFGVTSATWAVPRIHWPQI